MVKVVIEANVDKPMSWSIKGQNAGYGQATSTVETFVLPITGIALLCSVLATPKPCFMTILYLWMVFDSANGSKEVKGARET